MSGPSHSRIICLIATSYLVAVCLCRICSFKCALKSVLTGNTVISDKEGLSSADYVF